MRWRGLALLGFCAALCMGSADQGGQKEPQGNAKNVGRRQSDTHEAPPAPAPPGSSRAQQHDKPATPPANEKGWWGLSYEGWIAASTIILTIATIALGAFTLGLVLVTLRAVEDGRRSLRAARRSAKASMKAARVAERALLVVERPYLFLILNMGPPFDPAPFDTGAERVPMTMKFAWQNYGRTPAVTKLARYRIFIGPELPATPEYTEDARVGDYVIAADKLGDEDEWRLVGGVYASAAAKVLSGEEDVYFFCEVEYADVLGQIHTTGACVRWVQKDQIWTCRGGPAYNFQLSRRAPK